jgi:hypothetical protein
MTYLENKNVGLLDDSQLFCSGWVVIEESAKKAGGTRMENSGGRKALGRGAENSAVRPTVKATVKVIRYVMTFHALYTVYCILYTVYCILYTAWEPISRIKNQSDQHCQRCILILLTVSSTTDSVILRSTATYDEVLRIGVGERFGCGVGMVVHMALVWHRVGTAWVWLWCGFGGFIARFWYGAGTVSG